MSLRREDDLEALLTSLPVPAYVYSLHDQKVIACNNAFAELLGYTHSEMLARGIDDIRPVEDGRMREGAAPEQSPSAGLDWRYVHRDGSPVNVKLKYRNMSHVLTTGRVVDARFVVVLSSDNQLS